MVNAPVFYGSPEQPPPSALSGDSLPALEPTLDDLLREENWLEWRALAIPALRSTPLVSTDQTREEFVIGARLLRLDKRPRFDGRIGPTPIQLVIADTLNAGVKRNGILEPRRTSKTTSIQAVLLGRCSVREDYQVGWTLATTGQKASERFRKDIVAHVDRVYPDVRSRPFVVNVSNGKEHIRWPNGSWFNVYAPDGDGFRSGGFDVAWIDEGGEAEVDWSTDIKSAVLPTMDTIAGAQFVVSGTAAKIRSGNLLFDYVNHPQAAVLVHAIPDTTDPEELEAWEADEDHPLARVRELTESVHPGLGWTTPLAAVEENFGDLGSQRFALEYLGLFGEEGASTSLIPLPQWTAAGVDADLPPVPDYFTWAIAVHPDGEWASLGCAWYAPDGVPEVGLLHHQAGTKALSSRLLIETKKHAVPLTFDIISQAAAEEIEPLRNAKHRPVLDPAQSFDVRRAATKLLKAIAEGEVRHYHQAQLDAAAEIAVKRAIGNAGGFGFGRPKGQPSADITPLEAVSLALHRLAEAPKPAKVDIVWGAASR